MTDGSAAEGTSSCGFNHLPRHIALGKLRAMAAAKRLLGGVPG